MGKKNYVLLRFIYFVLNCTDSSNCVHNIYRGVRITTSKMHPNGFADWSNLSFPAPFVLFEKCLARSRNTSTFSATVSISISSSHEREASKSYIASAFTIASLQCSIAALRFLFGKERGAKRKCNE